MIEILVVDDHPLMRAGLQCLLDATVDLHVAATAAGGADAVRLCAELHPDLVLMDLCMPGMDGIEATRRVRSLDPAPTVVVLTSACVPALVQDAFAAGAGGYLLKDMPPERLVAALRGVEQGRTPLDPRVARILHRLERRTAAATLTAQDSVGRPG